MITKFKIFENKNIFENRNFQKWFDGSMVVDENDNPLIVYHGTNNIFYKFDLNKVNKSYVSNYLGFWFDINKNNALFYSMKNEKNEKKYSSIIFF